MQSIFGEARFITRLKQRRSVLIAGAGGGFDVFSGIPLYLALKSRGVEVHLANLSFTWLDQVRADRIGQYVVKVQPDSFGPREYFPERALSRWFRARGHSVPVYAIEKLGVRPLKEAYRDLKAALNFDTVVLVDGGTDILMRGDEAGLGTPQEDITSLAAVDALEGVEKQVVCLGFGIDRYHGICHAQFLENVAALSRASAFLGTLSLTPDLAEARWYQEAVAFAAEQMPQAVSIVSSSISSAISGEYGDVHKTPRTSGSVLWINPLMSLYWAFELGAVAKRCMYLDAIQQTETSFDVHAIIERFRETVPMRPWSDIPV